MKKKQLHLILFGTTGPESWLTDTAQLYDWRDPRLLKDAARLAELAKFDMILFADTLALSTTMRGNLQYAAQAGHGVLVDPVLTLSMLSAVTRHIGLGATMSSTYTPPFLLARQMASLDHLSGGRAAWNVVTSAQDEVAQNMGMALPDHDLRYDMADEHLALCRALWRGWDEDAVVMDRENRIFADHRKIHHADFKGKYYQSRGPLNIPSSPQREPVIVMAGASPRGQRFCAENAEVTIVNKNSIADIKAYSTSMRQQLLEAGRDPNACKLFFSVKPWIGESEQEALDKMERHRENARFEDGLGYLSLNLGYDLSRFDLDQPLPADLPIRGFLGKLLQYSAGEDAVTRMTLREICLHEARRETFSIHGTAEQVADKLEEAADEGDADGFNFRYVCQDLGYLTQVATKLVPILQKRGRVRSEYSGSTLRQHLFG